MADIINVGIQHFFQHVTVTDEVIGDLHTLYSRQLGTDKLLKCFLELGVARVSQLNDEAHHGRLGHADLRAQLGSRHIRRLVVLGQEISRNLTLSLREAIHIFFHDAKNVFFHVL